MTVSEHMPAVADSEMVVGSIPRHVVRTRPDNCALDDGQRRFSYRELDRQSDGLAGALRARGIGKGSVVGAYLPNCIEYVLVVLAVARAGAVFMPINPRFTAFEISGLLKVAKPRLIFTTGERLRTVNDAIARTGLSDPMLAVVGESVDAKPNVTTFAEMAECPVAPLPPVSPADPFSLMFTSGTTGRPKGALATHHARMRWVINAVAQYGVDDTDRYLGTMPQVHSAGLTFTLIHLYVGATVRILERFDPVAYLDILEREKISSSLTVPAMLTMVVEALDKQPNSGPFDSLKRLVTCGSPLPLTTKKKVIERISRELYDYYGSTESNSMTVLKPSDQLRKPNSVGKPFTGVEISIVGPNGLPRAPGETGEIWCANPSLMSEYWNDPEATAAAFTGRWYHTGDLGFLDEEGFLHLVGRTTDVVISGGINIHPAEIEQIIMLHPAVLDCAIVGVPDRKWGQSLKAFVVVREGQGLTLPQIQEHCRAYLADYKKPRSLEIVASIPKNAGGKTVKADLLASEGEPA